MNDREHYERMQELAASDEAARSYRRELFGRALELARELGELYDRAEANDEWPEPKAVGKPTIELADLVMQLGSIEDLPTVHLATGARITVDINEFEVSVIHGVDADGGHFLELQGQNCDLSGEMPGTYYPEPREA